MSLASPRNRGVLIPAVLALTVVLIAAFMGRVSESRRPTAMLSTYAPFTAVTGSGPAAIALGSVRAFYRRAPVVVMAPADDAAAQVLASTAAASLRVPILLADPSVGPELRSLQTRQVLAIGDIGTIDTSRINAVADPGSVAKAERSIRSGAVFTQPAAPRNDALVVTTSAARDVIPLTTARNAGATVIEVTNADLRRDPRSAAPFMTRPGSPVVALGNSLGDTFGYTLAVVRSAAQQPGGGYFVFPGRTMVALYGFPGAGSLGVLGRQSLSASIARARATALEYQRLSSKPVVPTFELIATVAAAGAGSDNNYSSEASIALLRPWVEQASRAGMYVVLDLQPGRSDFLSQAKRYEALLALPHVGLALDPEWRLSGGQKPLRQIGSVGVAEVNRTIAWLAELTRRHALPQKLLILHQFQSRMIQDRAGLDVSRPELSVLIHVDGQGTQPAKQGTWATIHRGAPRGVFWGWKNFFKEDKPTLSVAKTWNTVKPRPDFISYQ